MKHSLLIALLLFSPLAATAADAPQDPLALEDSQIDEATKAMEQAAQNLIHILGLILRSIPQFEAPEFLPNGDILIRRVPKNQPKTPDQQENPDSSKI